MRIEPYTPERDQAVEALQRRYIAVQPQGAKFVPKTFYEQHPAMESGQNVFCALNQSDDLVGYGALVPTPAKADSSPDVPNTIWIHIRVDPQADDWLDVQQALYQAILARASAYSQHWQGRETRLAIGYPDVRRQELDFFAAQGLQAFDALLGMRRDLTQPIPTFDLAPGLSVRRWSMESDEEKARYLAAEGLIFPGSSRTLEELRYYLDSWGGGTSITAFEQGEQIAGSMMAYWYRKGWGITEDVFVMPARRGQGVAKCLLAQGMNYLLENGIKTATLEVRESNQPAVGLYHALGYEVVSRELQMALVV